MPRRLGVLSPRAAPAGTVACEGELLAALRSGLGFRVRARNTVSKIFGLNGVTGRFTSRERKFQNDFRRRLFQIERVKVDARRASVEQSLI